MKSPLSIDPARAALLCIDLQEEHRRDARYLAEGYGAVLANVQRLQAAARAHGVQVCHSAYVVDVQALPAKRFHPMTEDGKSAFSDAGDPWSAICPEVGPAGEEPVLIKTDASAFARGDAEAILEARGIEWLIVVGVWTEACIAASVKDAVERGFRVMLVKDACGSGSRAMHETAILNLANRLYGGAVVDTSQACRLISGATLDAWQVRGAVPLRYDYDNAADLYRSL